VPKKGAINMLELLKIVFDGVWNLLNTSRIVRYKYWEHAGVEHHELTIILKGDTLGWKFHFTHDPIQGWQTKDVQEINVAQSTQKGIGDERNAQG